MAVAQGNFALGGSDPRMPDMKDEERRFSLSPGDDNYLRPQQRPTHDHTVTFEEYYHYAKLTREREDQQYLSDKSSQKTGIMATIFPSKSYKHEPTTGENEKAGSGSDKDESTLNGGHHLAITDQEWINASRVMRTASWAAIFYLITTDILGPFGVAFAFGTLGWGPGIGLYTVFGMLAGYSGYLLWQVFLGLDSDQYPVKTYGDLMFRLYGRIARHGLNFLQSVQLLCNVGIIVISNGQSLSQVAQFKLCYAVCCLIWALVGFAVGQVRTLQKYGWLANAAIWMNLLIIFISMGIFAHSVPNYAEGQAQSSGAALLPGLDIISPHNNTQGELVYPTAQHFAGLPEPGNFIGAIVGLMQGVYAYGGAMLFTEFMSEMRRPYDFYKPLICATLFIYIVYMFYGLYCYGFLGQWAFSVAYQGISNYAWQTVCNMLAVISGIIAAGLYGNIGIKVLYNQIFVDLFNAPALTTKSGKIMWAVIVPIYWSIAFIFAASVPDFFELTSVVAAVCIMQFTYTFPPLLALGFFIKKHALRSDEGFDPATGQVIRHDSGMKRLIRGFTSGPWWAKFMNVWNIIYAGGALACAGLGAYSACEALIFAFKQPQNNAFSCHSPLDPN